MTASTEQVHARVIELEVEHRDLDVAIDRLADTVSTDDLQLRRLK
jgi:hypothetical protein